MKAFEKNADGKLVKKQHKINLANNNGEFVFTYYKQNANKKIVKDQKKYELIGMSNHLGNIDGRHYVAYIKKNDTWYCYDDYNRYIVNAPLPVKCYNLL